MILRSRLLPFVGFLSLALSSCGLQKVSESTPTLGLTQAYQTVEAMLTQAYTPLPSTLTPTLTPTIGRTPAPRASTPLGTLFMTATSDLLIFTLTPEVTVCDQAAAGSPIDVTIPDDTEMRPGQTFTKIWKLQNVGSCTWTTAYAAVFFYGEQMGAPEVVSLGEDVLPGQTIEISIEMVAPTNPGTYQGNWKLRNASGQLFGIGPNGDAPFWVRIIVVIPATETPTSTSTPTLTPAPTYSPMPTATSTPAAQGIFDLAPGDRLDLDSAQQNPESGSDLAYQRLDFHWFMPWGGAQLGFYGDSQPSLQVCQSATMSSAPVAVESIPVGTYLCYQTGEDRIGWMQLKAYNASSSIATLEIFTWEEP